MLQPKNAVTGLKIYAYNQTIISQMSDILIAKSYYGDSGMKESNDNRNVTVHFPGNQVAPASRTRNITIGGARSSIRLEEAFWDGLDEILRREGLTLNDLVNRIAHHQAARANLSGAVRVFIHSYFYALSQDRTPKLPPGAAWKVHKPRTRESAQDPE